MARFDAAVPPLHASARRDLSGTGRIRSLRYRRLLTPIAFALLALIAALSLIIETLSSLYAARDQHLRQALEQTDAMASLIAERIDHPTSVAISAELSTDAGSPANAQKLLAAALPLYAQASETLVGVTDRSGQVVASLGFTRQIGSIADLVGGNRESPGRRAGAKRVLTPDGLDAIVAVRELEAPLGEVALVAPTSRMLSLWREHARQLGRVAAVISLVVVLLLFGLLWQRRRARDAQTEGDRIRVTMRTALTNIWRNEQELVEKEQRLIAALADLERSRVAVEQQSSELAVLADRYLDQRQRAENANRAKAEFLANMSHELRTPLNAIIGFSEIMETGMFGALGSEKYGEYVSDIRRSGQYLLSIVSDILEMARIEAGRRRIEKKPVQLKDLIGEAAVSIAGAADAKQLTLLVSAPADATVFVDSRALLKVLVHLGRNAIAHTRAGGSVKIKAKIYPEHIGIHVGDTGIGIPRDRLAELGRPFQRVNADPHRSSPGSGLGLAIARSLIELHGGRLRIRSREGRGTVVAMRLPRLAPYDGQTLIAGPVRPKLEAVQQARAA